MFDKLLEFEDSLRLNKSKNEASSALTDDMINEKYQKGEIRIVTEQARYPLNQIKEMMESSDYIMHPEFQRRLRWKRDKQSRLIESLIMNVPIPPIFLYECEFSKYEVMDGLQRLTAIKEFYNDVYPLEGLETWPELNGRFYSTLPEQIKKGIDRRYLSSVILLKETAKSHDEALRMKQLVFARINSGGAKLEDQEYRNAQVESQFNRLIIQLARNKYFCRIFDIPEPESSERVLEGEISEDLKDCDFFSKMKDVETILRFFAIRARSQWTNETFSKFLDMYFFSMRDVPNDVLTDCYNLFNETIKLAYEIYGEKCFSLWRKQNSDDTYAWGKRATLLMYDCVMASLSYRLEHSNELVEKKDSIIEDTKRLFERNPEKFNGRNTYKSILEERISLFDELFSKYHA